MNSPQNIAGPRIKEARESKGLTLAQLSGKCSAGDELHLTALELDAIESQTRVVSDLELVKIAEALGVSETFLLFGKSGLPWKN